MYIRENVCTAATSSQPILPAGYIQTAATLIEAQKKNKTIETTTMKGNEEMLSKRDISSIFFSSPSSSSSS